MDRMAQYPTLVVHTERVRANARALVKMCGRVGISVWGVTKALAGDPRLAKIFEEAGCAGVSDSRSQNLRDIRTSGVRIPRQLIRVAMPSELDELPLIADVSVQSELSVIFTLDEICLAKGVTHEVLIMIDIGDLREGFWPAELPDAGRRLRDLRGGVRVTGVATNFACASGVLPTRAKLEELLACRDTLRATSGLELPNVSVGGTCCLKLVEEGLVPEGINQIRVGEGALIARDTAFMRELPYLNGDTLTLEAEILECRDKPSIPSGEVGFQAFGEKPKFVDRGIRKRALLGIGRQDVRVDRLTPLQPGVEIVAASSDHMIVDVTEAFEGGTAYAAGDILTFRPLYPAMLAAATSKYVDVRFV